MLLKHICFWALSGAAALAAGISLVSMLQACDWTKVSTPARQFFYLHYYYRLAPGLCTACCDGPQWVNLLLVSVKQWLILSLAYVGLSGCSPPQYQANSFPIVCVVLALDIWSYCSGMQAWQSSIFISMFTLHGFID